MIRNLLIISIFLAISTSCENNEEPKAESKLLKVAGVYEGEARILCKESRFRDGLDTILVYQDELISEFISVEIVNEKERTVSISRRSFMDNLRCRSLYDIGDPDGV